MVSLYINYLWFYTYSRSKRYIFKFFLLLIIYKLKWSTGKRNILSFLLLLIIYFHNYSKNKRYSFLFVLLLIIHYFKYSKSKRYTFLFVHSWSKKYTFLIYSRFDWKQNLYLDKQTKFDYAKIEQKKQKCGIFYDSVKFFTLHSQENDILRLPSSSMGVYFSPRLQMHHLDTLPMYIFWFLITLFLKRKETQFFYVKEVNRIINLPKNTINILKKNKRYIK